MPVLFFRGEIFERYSIEYSTNLSLNPLPYRMNITVSGPSAIRRRDDAPVRNDRPFNRFNNFKQSDAFGGATQHKSAAGAPEGLDQTHFTELLENLGKERGGDINCGCYITQQADLVNRFSGKIDDASDCIFTFTSQFHHLKPLALTNRIRTLQ